MRNSSHYGEVVAIITDHLTRNPDHKIRIENVLSRDLINQQSLYTMCAEAARIFQSQDDLSGNHFLDWHRALDEYAGNILDCLLSGRAPNIPNMLSMAAQSIEKAT